MLVAEIIIIAVITNVFFTATAAVTEKQRSDANAIIDYLTKGTGKGKPYAWLTRFTDKYGNRFVAGDHYDPAADYLIAQLQEVGVDRLWTEDVPGLVNWSRGTDPDNPDHAVLLKPRRYVFPVLALLNSTATPKNGGIRASVVVVRSFNELALLPDNRVRGSIVVYNQPWVDYFTAGIYRKQGPTEAAKRGAIGALVRSLTPNSLYTLHAGSTRYANDSKLQIPAATITVEDAELLYRLQEAGHELELSLEINSIYRGTISRRTVVAEIKGATKPDEMVLFGGHLDSWDVGTGALDDGGGVAITLHSLKAIKALGLRPKRTIRAVFWTGEEYGYVGANAYYNAHKNESDLISLVMESDSGTFKPMGFKFGGTTVAKQMLQEVADLLEPLNATRLVVDGEIPGDPEAFYDNDSVPAVELATVKPDEYFWYHHTSADTMTILDPNELDTCTAMFATLAYVTADLDEMLPHGKSP